MSNIVPTPAVPVLDPPCSTNNNAPDDPAFAVMAAMADHYASTWEKTPELRTLRREQLMVHYGWTSETIARFKVGFDDGSVVEHLRSIGFTDEQIRSTGAFYRDSYGAIMSRFAGRIVFPYLDAAGLAVYFAARQTALTPPWMKDGEDQTRKYLKTQVHAETRSGDDDGISPRIKNVIWSTHEPTRKQRFGIIAEGMPDAISAAQAGYPVRSPVTTCFKESDAEVIDELTSGWGTAVLIPDMEQNESGIRGATKTAGKLIAMGRDIRIAILPHEDIKAKAEARVEELRRVTTAAGTTAPADEIKRVGNWKTDLNEYLAAPNEANDVMFRLVALRASAKPQDDALMKEAKIATMKAISAIRAERREGLRRLVENARLALDVMIEMLPKKPTPSEFATTVNEVTRTIAKVENDAEREVWIDRLKAHVGGRIAVLRNMVEQDQDEDAEPESPLTSILAGMHFFRILTGRVFTTLNGFTLPVDGEEFASWLSNKCYETSKAVVGTTAIKDAIRAVVGVSTKLPIGVAPVRYAYDPSGNGIWIDLADKNSSFVHVTTDKITIETHCPTAFYRPTGTGTMPLPEIIGKPEECVAVLDEYFAFLAIDRKSRAGLFAVMMSAMRPMEQPANGALTRYAVGVFNGEHGSGKSTRQMFVRRTIDMREPASMKMPDKVDDMIIYCEHSAVVSLDNQSALSETMSDALCRVATGDGNVKRSLYTSRDLAVFRGSRPIFVNGITDVVTRDDLLDRSIIVHVEKPATRKTDDELEASFKTILPRVFGALLLCMQNALIHESSTDTDRSIRMLQAARWAAAAEVTAGFDPGEVEQAYLAARREAVSIAADDPFVSAILGIVAPGTTWKGTMTALTEQLIEHVEERDACTGKAAKKAPKDFPTTVAKVRSMVKRKQPALRALGLELERRAERTDTSSNATMISLTRKPLPQNVGEDEEAVTCTPTTNGVNGTGIVVDDNGPYAFADV